MKNDTLVWVVMRLEEIEKEIREVWQTIERVKREVVSRMVGDVEWDKNNIEKLDHSVRASQCESTAVGYIGGNKEKKE